MGSNTVLAMRCETYDRKSIEKIIKKGMQVLGYAPRGNLFVKPNVVFAFKTDQFGDTAYTAPPLVGACLNVLASGEKVSRVDMGEKCAIGFPTRFCYKAAGYFDELRLVKKKVQKPVSMFCMDEEKRSSVFVGGKVHDRLRIPTKMAVADSKIYLPKLKCHCVSKMTGAVKLNIGICSDDERAIRHDFMLNEKIVDLLTPGYPDFIVMDAIDVGVGNEAFPTKRKLGMILMGTNPLAVDMIGARLLGMDFEQVPYLKAAIDRGYTPGRIDEVELKGDLESLDQIDEQAKRLLPYDDEFYGWQDIDREFARLNTPMRFEWGSYKKESNEKCLTGCVMGVKMFLGGLEKFAGSKAFANANPAVFVIGKHSQPIDARGAEVFQIGACSEAKIINAKKVIRMDKCFTTASDMNLTLGNRLGIPTALSDRGFVAAYATAIGHSIFRKIIGMRYIQDAVYFVTQRLIHKI